MNFRRIDSTRAWSIDCVNLLEFFFCDIVSSDQRWGKTLIAKKRSWIQRKQNNLHFHFLHRRCCCSAFIFVSSYGILYYYIKVNLHFRKKLNELMNMCRWCVFLFCSQATRSRRRLSSFRVSLPCPRLSMGALNIEIESSWSFVSRDDEDEGEKISLNFSILLFHNTVVGWRAIPMIDDDELIILKSERKRQPHNRYIFTTCWDLRCI